MSLEYRVVWKRKDTKQRTRLYRSLWGAKRFMVLLSSEPWKAFDKDADGDDFVCCSDHECACQAITHRQLHQEKFKDVAALEYASIEVREVGEFRKLEAITH